MPARPAERSRSGGSPTWGRTTVLLLLHPPHTDRRGLCPAGDGGLSPAPTACPPHLRQLFVKWTRRHRFPDRPYMSSSRAAEACVVSRATSGSSNAMRPLTAKSEGAGELVHGAVW